MSFDPYSFLRFYYNIPELNYWLIIFGSSFALLLILTLIFSSFLFKKANFQKRYQLNLVFKTSSIIVLFLITCMSVWFTFYDNIIYTERLQLPILVDTILIVLVYFIVGYLNSSKVSKNNLKYIGIFQGPISERNEKVRIRKYTNKFKLYYLLVFIPFLLLLFKFEKKYFYSIVYDASSSMLSSLENTQYYLNENINNLDVDADFMISTIPSVSETKTAKRPKLIFENTKYETYISTYLKKGKLKVFIKDSLTKITSVRNSEKLFSTDIPFSSVSDFINYIDEIELGHPQAGSPISEIIWSNFLESMKFTGSDFYNKKKLIVITDGGDNLMASKDWGCVLNSSFETKINGQDSEVFPSDFYDDITFLDVALSDEKGSLLGECQDLINVENGSDEESFAYVFDEQLHDIYVDKDFLFYLSIFLVFGGLLSTLITVKN